ncbi:MAG: lysophospholipid acyltransferase family protein, partial [candidate division WOR-3 bacterium]
MSWRLRWRVGWYLTYPLARLFLGLRVHGREHLTKGPLILAANHVSNFDPLIIGWAVRREVHFLAKEELFQQSKLFAWL